MKTPAPAAAAGASRLEASRLKKSYGARMVVKDVHLAVDAGEVVGLLGPNGAGKTTTFYMVVGLVRADAGDIRIDGQPVAIRSSQDAIRAGIGMVHQHFMLVDTFTVLENVCLGVEGGFRLREGMARARKTLEALERDYKLEVPLDAVVGDLAVGIQQRVE
ncbi:MAG: ATP-binding cassette domain-containing protein, partial [Burkholderiaceae bacterium]